MILFVSAITVVLGISFLCSIFESVLLTTSAAPPSEIRQQSSMCSGVAIVFDASTCSTVIGSRLCAFG